MNSAELLNRIEEAAVNGDVVEALLLCQTLGGDADSAELQEWVRHELEGYPLDASPPDYRRVMGQLVADGAAPGRRLSGVPIPMDALTDGLSKQLARGIPLWDSISVIVARSTGGPVGWTPGNAAELLHAVNSSNASLTRFDHVYFKLSGPAFSGVVTAVRSRIVELVAQLRLSHPADEQLDPAAVQLADSEVSTGSVVNVTGDHNRITVGDSGDAQVCAGSDGRSTDKPMSGVWRWVKRIVEAITVIGSVAGTVGSSSFNPF